jgi:hypothetical protein
MTTFPLIVESKDGQAISQGTGWFIEPTLVATAFHVVGNNLAREFFHQRPQGAQYALQMGAVRNALDPIVFDSASDIALLRSARPGSGGDVLALSDESPARDVAWRGEGYPAFHGGRRFTLSGRVTDVRGQDPGNSLQLLVEQETQVNWEGASGTPVCRAGDDRVIGVVTQMTAGTKTGWAASVESLHSLVSRLREDRVRRGDVAGDWTVGGREDAVRETLQWLGSATMLGVGLLEPLGFGGSRIVDEVLATLRRPKERLLPVRLVPDRSSSSEARLYDKLLSDLKDELTRTTGLVIKDAWWNRMAARRAGDGASDAFDRVVERLLVDHIGAHGRTLVLVLEGLARVEMAQLRRWGYLVRRFQDRGLKVLTWGREELYDLMTRPGEDGLVSAFNDMKAIAVSPLAISKVGDLVEGSGLPKAVLAPKLWQVTQGHPALVAELLGSPRILDSDEGSIENKLLQCMHMNRVSRELSRDEATLKALRGLSKLATTPMRRQWGDVAEERLSWLGIVTDVEGGWRWTAPLMRRLAKELG